MSHPQRLEHAPLYGASCGPGESASVPADQEPNHEQGLDGSPLLARISVALLHLDRGEHVTSLSQQPDLLPTHSKEVLLGKRRWEMFPALIDLPVFRTNRDELETSPAVAERGLLLCCTPGLHAMARPHVQGRRVVAGDNPAHLVRAPRGTEDHFCLLWQRTGRGRPGWRRRKTCIIFDNSFDNSSPWRSLYG